MGTLNKKVPQNMGTLKEKGGVYVYFSFKTLGVCTQKPKNTSKGPHPTEFYVETAGGPFRFSTMYENIHRDSLLLFSWVVVKKRGKVRAKTLVKLGEDATQRTSATPTEWSNRQ